jgi:hypothetical protein
MDRAPRDGNRITRLKNGFLTFEDQAEATRKNRVDFIDRVTVIWETSPGRVDVPGDEIPLLLESSTKGLLGQRAIHVRVPTFDLHQADPPGHPPPNEVAVQQQARGCI